jgi:hypothetical protein
MQRLKHTLLGITLVLVLLLSGAAALANNQGSSYAVDWFSIDGGGAMFVEGGEYKVGSTIGQSDAAHSASSEYTIRSGFWIVADEPTQSYLPVILR